MPASINSQTFADQERQSIEYAKQSLSHGEPDSKITAQIIQSYYPNDPAQGYDHGALHPRGSQIRAESGNINS